MDTPAARWRDVELAYAAGVIDGEGCIGLYGDRTAWQITIKVHVQMTDRTVLEWFRYTFGGRITKPRVPTDAGRSQTRDWKPAQVWYCQSKVAYEFICAVLPWLRLKRMQAEIAEAFYRQCIMNKTSVRLTEENKWLREMLWSRMRLLNRRGLSQKLNAAESQLAKSAPTIQ